jgi:hypothetical protein
MSEQLRQLVTMEEFKQKVRSMSMSYDGFNFGIVKFKGFVECESALFGDCDDGFSFVPMIIIGNADELHLQMLDIIRDAVNESEYYHVIETEVSMNTIDNCSNNIYIHPTE